MDEGAGAYRAVIERGSPDDRLLARLGLAKLLLDERQDATAIAQLDAYLIEAPISAAVGDAQLLLAEALKDMGRYAEALPLYESNTREQGSATAYAELGRAEVLARLGDVRASDAGEAVLGYDLPKATRLSFITTMAQALEAELPQDALVWYERLERESSSTADDALAIWRSAMIQREGGNDGPWFAAWPTIMKRYPDTPTAAEAVNQMPLYKTPAILVDPYYTGIVHYEAGDSAKARADFLASVSMNRGSDDKTPAARASFYLAVLDERASNAGSAIKRYSDVVALDPKVDLADDALWWQGRLYEQQRQMQQARGAYERILSDFAGSGYAKEARFRLALLTYDTDEPVDAAAAFHALAESSKGSEKQRALLWEGKALEAAGRREEAEPLWQSVASEGADSYYGLRAAVLLGEGRGKLRDGQIITRRPDWAAIETWLRAAGAGDPSAATLVFASNEHWGRGWALASLGMERANAEFDMVLESSLGDPNMLLLLSKQFYEAGQYGLSARAATRLLTRVPKSALSDAPQDVWRLAYPAPFAGAFAGATQESEVPNVLLLSLVRQESFFEPLAGSSAGAIGLTQLIEPTANQVATELDVDGFETEDLYRPQTSLRFGAYYLHEQLDQFDGNFYFALAAYNAGPGSAQRWARAAGGDVDRFMAEVEFSQTEEYVQRVSENLARYRQLYEGLDEPALPND